MSLSLQELIGGNFTIQLAYRKEEPGRTVEVQFHQEKGYSAELV
jgi:hypothetical protein